MSEEPEEPFRRPAAGIIVCGDPRRVRGRYGFLSAVIENGRMVEEGSHEELLAQREKYYRLYRNQFVRETEERMLEEVR